MQRYENANFSPRIILSSVLLVLISFFFVFSAGSYLEVGIFPLEERQTIQKSFHIYIFDQTIDSIIISLFTISWFATTLFGKAKTISLIICAVTFTAFVTGISALLDFVSLISIPMIASIFIYSKFSTKKILKISSSLTFAIFAIFGIGLGVFSLIISTSIPNTLGLRVNDYAFNIFILISVLSSVLILFLVAGSVVRLFLINSFKKLKINSQSDITSTKLNSKTKILFLTLFMALSVFVVLVPHSPAINTENKLVGADSGDYVRWINELKSYDDGEFFNQIFFVHKSSDRPISILFFYSLVEIIPDSPLHLLDHIPLFLAPALVLTTFFLTREITSNDKISLLASFITASSFHVLIGTYSGFYANWVALIVGYLSFVFLLKSLKLPTKKNYLLFSILLFLLLFSHVYTWTILALFMLVFLGVTYKLKFFKKRNTLLILVIILSSVAVDVAKTTFTDSAGGIEQDIAIASTRAGSENALVIWENLTQSVHIFSGGLFSNVLILFLCALWLVRSNFQSFRDVFIGIFFSIALFPILFGNDIIQTRVLYEIPFQIPAAIGLMYFFNRPYGRLFVFSVCILILAMAVKTASNLI